MLTIIELTHIFGTLTYILRGKVRHKIARFGIFASFVPSVLHIRCTKRTKRVYNKLIVIAFKSLCLTYCIGK